MSEVTLHYSSITIEINSAARDVNLLEAASQLQSPIMRSWSTQSKTIITVLTRYLLHTHSLLYWSRSQSQPSRIIGAFTYTHKKQIKRTCLHPNRGTQPASIMNWYFFHLLHLPATLDYRFCHRVLQRARLSRLRQNKAAAEPMYIRNIRSDFSTQQNKTERHKITVTVALPAGLFHFPNPNFRFKNPHPLCSSKRMP